MELTPITALLLILAAPTILFIILFAYSYIKINQTKRNIDEMIKQDEEMQYHIDMIGQKLAERELQIKQVMKQQPEVINSNKLKHKE